MPLRQMIRGLLVKLETTYGTDSTPIGANDGVLCRSITPAKPLDQKAVDRNLIRPYFGQFQQLLAGAFAVLECEVEVAGFGSAGPASPTPGLDALLQICGLSRTVTAGTSVVYAPVSSAQKSGTVYFYQDGTLHKMTGCVADVEMTVNIDEIPVWKFTISGIYNTVADVAMPAITLSAYQTPVLPNVDTVTGATLFGYAACINKFGFKLGNQVVMRELMNCQRRLLIVDRKPEGSIELEATTVATHDWWTSIKTAALGSLSFALNGGAGNTVALAASSVQMLSPAFTDQDSLVHLTSGLRFLPSTGNDEFSLTVT